MTDDLKLAVFIKTCPFERIARAGYNLAVFRMKYPAIKFDWYEDEYFDPDDLDDPDDYDSDQPNEDGEYMQSPDSAVFIIEFETKEDRAAYEALRNPKAT